MNTFGKVVNAEILTNAIRALGHAPYTCPAEMPTGICRLVAAHGREFPDYRLQNLAVQFGLEWAFQADDISCNYWVLTS